MYYDLKESGKRIATLRKEKGFTQETFAKELGMSEHTISAVERGIRGLSIDALITVSELLECTLDYLILGKKNNFSFDIPEDKREFAAKMLKAILENM